MSTLGHQQPARVSAWFRAIFQPQHHSQARCRGFDPRLPLHPSLTWLASELRVASQPAEGCPP